MWKIYKYKINVEEIFELELPKAAQILTVQTQGDSVCMWVLHNTEAEKEKRAFRIVGTGQSLEANFTALFEHVGTFQQGVYVWHLFEAMTVGKALSKHIGIF